VAEKGVSAMAEVLDVQADMLNFKEEAKGCLELAKDEEHQEVRTVLMGMAVGWLKMFNIRHRDG
jgi:hypothetical protein